MENQVQSPMPESNMILAIFTTVCCCLPLGIVAIIKANSVSSLYAMHQYDAAVAAANDAKKWSYIGIGVSLVGCLIYVIAFGGLAMLSSYM